VCRRSGRKPVAEIPPRRALGDLAFPTPLHLAKALNRKPREIAEALAASWRLPAGVRELRVEGAGYLNLFFDRSAFAAGLLSGPVFAAETYQANLSTMPLDQANRGLGPQARLPSLPSRARAP